jgi:DNA-binding transcriptional ArsR family regulator
MRTKTPPSAPCCNPADFPRADLFRALGDANRLAILAGIASCCGESRTVSEVAREIPKDLSVVSRHLGTLRDAGVLRSERRGKEVHYFCCYEELVSALRSLADAIEACCPSGTCGSAESRGSAPSVRAQTSPETTDYEGGRA